MVDEDIKVAIVKSQLGLSDEEICNIPIPTLKKIYNLIGENQLNRQILQEKQIYINKLKEVTLCSTITCEECGAEIFL